MEPRIYQALALAAGLRLYAKTRIKPNRAWTPKGMRETAERITGRKFQARDYQGMADALQSWAKAQAAEKSQGAPALETVS